jgi:hypothetical protein
MLCWEAVEPSWAIGVLLDLHPTNHKIRWNRKFPIRPPTRRNNDPERPSYLRRRGPDALPRVGNGDQRSARRRECCARKAAMDDLIVVMCSPPGNNTDCSESMIWRGVDQHNMVRGVPRSSHGIGGRNRKSSNYAERQTMRPFPSIHADRGPMTMAASGPVTPI